MSEQRIVIITREKPQLSDFFVYDNDSPTAVNFERFIPARDNWLAACEEWRNENAPPRPAECNTPFPVDTPHLGWHGTYLRGLFLKRAEAVYVIVICTIFYIFWW